MSTLSPVHDTLPDKVMAAFLRHPVLIMVAYFAANAILRSLLGAPPELDEAEQFAISTHYSFGYGPHPPLYQWLQVTAFKIFGVNYVAIAVLKNTILFGTYFMLYRLGLLLTNDQKIAVLGSFGLLLSTNFAWESQHDQSHTVSNTFLTVTIVYVAFHALQKVRAFHFALLGCLIGLWALAKYNFVFPLAGLLFALSSYERGRNLLLRPAILVTVAFSFTIAYLHYHYILNNVAEATVKVAKLGIENQGFFATRFEGLGAFANAVFGVHIVWFVLVGLGWLKICQKPKDWEPGKSSNNIDHLERQRIFTTFCLTTYGLLILFVLIAGTTRYRDHWLQPAAVFAPLLISIFFQRYLTRELARPIFALFSVVMPIIMFAYVLNNLGIGTDRRDSYLPSPGSVASIVPDVQTGSPTLVFAASKFRHRWLTAGHLRSFFPNIKMIYVSSDEIEKHEDFWLIWRTKGEIWENSPPEIQKAIAQFPSLNGIAIAAFSKPVALEYSNHGNAASSGEQDSVIAQKWWISRYTPPIGEDHKNSTKEDNG